MLRLERLLNVLVEPFVRAGGFGGVQVAAASYVTIGRVKVERARDDVERRERKKLCDD